MNERTKIIYIVYSILKKYYAETVKIHDKNDNDREIECTQKCVIKCKVYFTFMI